MIMSWRIKNYKIFYIICFLPIIIYTACNRIGVLFIILSSNTNSKVADGGRMENIMGLFFGTDGIRGIVNEDLGFEVAFKCGNALSTVKSHPTVLIGRDTRISGEYLTHAVTLGVMSGGGNVIDMGVMPTAAVAYLTKNIRADFGVVISASHNPREYNGIKVFGSDGYKLSDKDEERLERCFINTRISGFPNIGRSRTGYGLYKRYVRFLVGLSKNRFDGIRVVLDTANGAAYKIAPAVFRALGADVVAINSKNDGMKINVESGALNPEGLAKRMKKYGADIGFAFDGDADRLITVLPDGRVIDGDMMLYMLAAHFKREGRLSADAVVGTSHTNMAIEHALGRLGIKLVRADVGDKYVLAKLLDLGLNLGAEQSGHIIIKDFHTTGDGILSAISILNMMKDEQKTLAELMDIELYPQVNLNVTVSDKLKIMNNQGLANAISHHQKELGGHGRIMVRASGTEPKIRIMVEGDNDSLNQSIAEELAEIIKAIELDA